MKAIFIFFFFFLIPLMCLSQSPLRVRTDLGPIHAIMKVLLGDNNDLKVSNITYSGQRDAMGVFSNSSKYYMIKRGVILSTGLAEDAIGPNDAGDQGIALGSNGNQDLELLISGKTYDAGVLSFDFIPNCDSIYFRFVFASEEYPEYVHKGVNDVFGFFLDDLENKTRKNLAILNGREVVNVDNINHLRNHKYYIPNEAWNSNNIEKFKDDPGLGELSMTYQYDGFTTVLTVGSSVIKGRSYKLTFAIADVGDNLYDSAVFLEAGSFNSTSDMKENLIELEKELKEEISTQSVVFREFGESLVLRLKVNFEFDEYEVKADSSLKVLNAIARILRLKEDLNVKITGHTDNFGSEDYNLNLSDKRAEFAREYIMGLGVLEDRITSLGEGDHRPISENITARGRLENRRIEFEFFYQE